MDERRHLNLASRQLVLAKIARREAMAALADAVSEEARSTNLAERSRALLREYSQRADPVSGDTMRDQAAFVRSLQSISNDADQASKDASDQAKWQTQTLAAAETRASRFEERKQAALRDMDALRSKREAAPQSKMPQKMAHKLQSR